MEEELASGSPWFFLLPLAPTWFGMALLLIRFLLEILIFCSSYISGTNFQIIAYLDYFFLCVPKVSWHTHPILILVLLS